MIQLCGASRRNTAGDPGSNPGPGENFFLFKLRIQFQQTIILKTKFSLRQFSLNKNCCCMNNIGENFKLLQWTISWLRWSWLRILWIKIKIIKKAINNKVAFFSKNKICFIIIRGVNLRLLLESTHTRRKKSDLIFLT